MDTIFFVFSFLFLCILHPIYTMDSIPEKEPKREKKSLVPRLWGTKETSPTLATKQELITTEEKRPHRIINSAPPSLTAKTIEQANSKSFTTQFSTEHSPRKQAVAPVIIATSPADQFNVNEQRDGRSKDDKRQKYSVSRSLSPSPSKEKTQKTISEKFSNSDPDKSIFKRSPRDKATRTTISSSPRKSPKNLQTPTDFQSAVDAIRAHQINPIHAYIADKKNDLNKKDIHGNTLLHHAMLQIISLATVDPILKKIFNLLAYDSRTDILVKNDHNYASFQLLAEDDIKNNKDLFDELQQLVMLARVVYAILVTKLIAKSCEDRIVQEEVKKVYKKIPQGKIPSIIDASCICSMVHARLHTDKPMIQIMHDQYQDNPNCKDAWGQTLFHHIAYLRDAKLLSTVFTTHPGARCDEPDLAGFIPSASLYSLEDRSLRRMFFSNSSLHKWIKEAVDAAPLKYPMIKNFNISTTNDEGFLILKNSIIELAKEIEDNQKGAERDDRDRALPKKSASLPDYADDTFLLAAIVAYMKIAVPIPRQALDCLQYFNPNPVFTESSESKDDKKEKAHTSSNLDKQLSDVEKTMMEEMENGSIKAISSDSSLVKLDSSSSSMTIDKKTTG